MTTSRKLKTKLTKAQMREVLIYYTNRLTQEFGNRWCTQSMLIEAQSKIDDYRVQGRRFSTNPGWDVDVKVVPSADGSAYVVTILDESSVLYLDFDS